MALSTALAVAGFGLLGREAQSLSPLEVGDPILGIAVSDQQSHGSGLNSASSLPTAAGATLNASSLWSPKYQQYMELIHIPRTGGTSIESWAMHHSVRWGSHRDWTKVLPSKGEATFSTGSFVSAARLAKGDGNGSVPGEPSYWLPAACPAWHIPRRAYVAQGGIDPYRARRTFCAVRHPFTRAVSDYAFLQTTALAGFYGTKKTELMRQLCNADMLNAYLQAVLSSAAPLVQEELAAWPDLNLSISVNQSTPTLLSAIREVPTLGPFAEEHFCDRIPTVNCGSGLLAGSCHNLPQWMYLHTFEATQGKFESDCDVVLREERLTEDFEDMLIDAGRSDLASSLLQNQNHDSVCDLNATMLTQTTVDLLTSVYQEDFVLLNYTPSVQAALDAGRRRPSTSAPTI